MTGGTPDPRARRMLALLMLAQAVLGAQMPMAAIIAGLAGLSLAPHPCLATLPLSAMLLGAALAAGPLSRLMQHHGRRAGLMPAALAGAGGAALAAYALGAGLPAGAGFGLLLGGSCLSGVAVAAQGFLRFVAAEAVPPAYQPQAISLVVGGGLAAALIGPQLVSLTAESTAIPFVASYLAMAGLNLMALPLLALIDLPRASQTAAASSVEAQLMIAGADVFSGGAEVESRSTAADAGESPVAAPRSRRALLGDPRIRLAILCAAVSHAAMNLVMAASPLAVVGCGFARADAANVVSAHVLAMFGPAFFTGHLITRLGRETVTILGLALLAAAVAFALSGVALGQFYAALILLGLGWNFGFIGATTMLAAATAPGEARLAQGMNEMAVLGTAFLASLLAGVLMNCAGGTAAAGWQTVNLLLLPLLILSGAALIHAQLGPRETR